MQARTPIALIALALAAAPLTAQGPRAVDPWLVRARVAPDAMVRITTLGQSVRVGRFSSASDTALVLRGPFAGPPVRWADVGRVETRVNAAGKGAAIGAIVGGVGGALFFGYMSYAVCDAATCGVSPGASLLGGVLGAAAGALTGAAFGAMTSTWRRIYP